jgi:hypothetical protein
MYSVVGPRLSVAEGSRASFLSLSLGLVENPVLADLNTVAICIMVSVLSLAAWQGLGCLTCQPLPAPPEKLVVGYGTWGSSRRHPIRAVIFFYLIPLELHQTNKLCF